MRVSPLIGGFVARYYPQKRLVWVFARGRNGRLPVVSLSRNRP